MSNIISLSLPLSLSTQLDEEAKAAGLTRSRYVKNLLAFGRVKNKEHKS